mmetsp:Transcript_17520/g.55435  ORF Transcript_17520/g.55435 Transcript_17520/m.55435 type:complete len:205 (-) Transcript_17520:195-809(-)
MPVAKCRATCRLRHSKAVSCCGKSAACNRDLSMRRWASSTSAKIRSCRASLPAGSAGTRAEVASTGSSCSPPLSLAEASLAPGSRPRPGPATPCSKAGNRLRWSGPPATPPGRVSGARKSARSSPSTPALAPAFRRPSLSLSGASAKVTARSWARPRRRLRFSESEFREVRAMRARPEWLWMRLARSAGPATWPAGSRWLGRPK